MKVIDTKAPKAAVGGFRSPASGTLELDFAASDEGVGLAYAEAGIVGQPMKREYFNTACRDLTEGGDIDLPLSAVETNGPCEKVARKTVSVDTTGVADGDQKIEWRVVDLAGNVWPAAGTPPTDVSILNNINLGTNTQTLSIGTSGTTTPASNNTNTNTGTGGVAGATSQSCTSPRLSFSLSQKPMRVSRGVPVLQKGKRYRFNGRLTCVINGKRKSAPKRTRVDILNKVGKLSLEKAGTTVGRQRQAHGHPGLPVLAHDHLPLHQQQRTAFAGEHQGAGRQEEEEVLARARTPAGGSHMKRYMALGAVLVTLGVGGTALGEKAAAGGAAAQAIGGLAMMPALIEHNAQPGVLTSTLVLEPVVGATGGHRHGAALEAGGHREGVAGPPQDAPGHHDRPDDLHARSRR